MSSRLLIPSLLVLALAACGGSSNNNSNGNNDNPPPAPPVVEPPPPPPVVEPTPNSISLSFVNRYSSGVFAESAAEIVTFDPASQRTFVVNAQAGELDVLELDDDLVPSKVAAINVSDIAADATVNSVAIFNGVLALAIEPAVKTDNGFVALYRADNLEKIAEVQVGALPDMLTFTPDGNWLLVANEGEPSDDYQTDPEGSISVIDVSDLDAIDQDKVRTAGFTAFNDQRAALLAAGVRIFGPGASVAQDMEPEYIAVSADSRTAWAALQENNAVAVIDIETATVTEILPLGYKDHGAAGNGMDAADEDGNINITLLPGVNGIYHPDAMAAYEVDGKTYLITANEGDARAWGEGNADYWGSQTVSNGNSPTTLCTGGDATKGFVEEFRIKHLTDSRGYNRRCGEDLPPQLAAIAGGAFLNPDNFGWCGATDVGTNNSSDPRGGCDDSVFGRLNITWTLGYQTWESGAPKLFNRETGVALPEGTAVAANTWLKYDNLYAFGARSYSIWDSSDMSLVFDSGDFLEQYLASDDCMLGENRDIPCKNFFNSNHEEGDAFDNRSDNKGPEPEGLTIGKIGDKRFLFLGLERMGGVMVFDVTNPQAPVFQDYLNTREEWATGNVGSILGSAGDLGPEGLHFIPASDSPNGKPLLMVGNEVSGTTAIYEIEQQF